MTIRNDMRATVHRAGETLGDAAGTVRDFLLRQIASDGGFLARDGRSDLYYSMFGLEASLALDAGIGRERIANYLEGFGTGQALDLVHLASLIRCRANMADAAGEAMDDGACRAAIEYLQQYRTRGGGFSTTAGAERGNAYGSFLALGAYQDLGAACPNAGSMIASVTSLQMPDGGYSNESTMMVSATAATAAAVCVLHYLDRPVPEPAIRWLLGQARPLGGFAAIRLASAPAVPDLLSTATALHALSLAGASVEDATDRHLDYLDSLWSPQGGFRGHWADETVDCEYTYYGLLALGCLST